jgi:predicted HTH transcriptional regulator
MGKLFKGPFKIILFVLNIIIGIIATIYLVLKFKSRRKKKSTQLPLIEDTTVTPQNTRTEEVYKIIKEMKEVDMAALLNKIKGVTERTLRRDLAKLQTMHLIKKSGSTKSAKYTLNK